MTSLSMIIPHFMSSNLIFSYHFSFTALHCTVLSCIIVFSHNTFLFLFSIHLKFLSLLLLLNYLSYFYHHCYYHSYYFSYTFDHRSQYCHFCYYSFPSHHHFLITSYPIFVFIFLLFVTRDTNVAFKCLI